MDHMSLDTLTSWYCRKNVVEDVTIKKGRALGLKLKALTPVQNVQ
jgi:hypothetical protein